MPKATDQVTLDKVHVYRRFVLDIETMIRINEFNFNFTFYKMGLGYKEHILIGLYDGKDYMQFNNFKDCLSYIFAKSEYSIIYCHNGGKYDFLYLIEESIKEYSLSNIITLGSNIIFDIKKGNRKIIFRDSFKLMPKSLDSLGESFCTDFKKIKMDYNQIYCLYEIEKYLKYDCLTLFDCLKAFEKEIQVILNNSKFNIDKYKTLAGLSFSILNEKYLKGITRNNFTKENEEWIRKAYYGGRTEIFKFHGKNLNYVDVNSMYPFVMKEEYYPIGTFMELKSHNAIERLINTELLGIVEAEVNYPYNYICMLPYKQDKKLIFPYGKFRGNFTTEEIKEALKQGVEFHYIKAIFWYKKAKIFNDYVADFYAIKQNSKGAKREIAKLLLNTSYGKWGQKRNFHKIISKKEFIKKDDDTYEMIGEGLFYSKKYTSYANRKINPVYAVFVTSYARLHLFRIMQKIGLQHIYYIDTDSVICDKEINKEMLHDSKIGYLKKEVDIIHEGIFISPKCYAIRYTKNGKIKLEKKIKGIEKENFCKMNIESFREIKENHISFTTKRMVSFKQKFVRNDFEMTKEYVNIEESKKILSGEYNKRIAKGNMTEPIKIEL